MWTICKDYAEVNRFRHYSKRHPREVAACFANLDRAMNLLDGGLTLDRLATTRFFSSEGNGLFRIGQTGVPNAHESRLYVHVAVANGTVYVLTIGDKGTQADDINRCKAAIKTLPAQQEKQQ